jgi:RNase P/RNase MRP subunit POP5
MIKKSLRERKRYIVFNTFSEGRIDVNELKNAIIDICFDTLGLIDFAKANIQILEIDEKKGIIKVSNEKLNEVKFALSLLRKVNNNEIMIICKKVYGTLKKAKIEGE